MRCRNCHTVLMETDRECPKCHASAASAISDAPAPTQKVNGLLLALPIFGGAIGGALASGIMIANQASDPHLASKRASGGQARGGSSFLKLLIGIVILLAGGLFLAVAIAQFRDIQKLTEREARDLTAAELLQTKDPESFSGAWLAFNFEKSHRTDLTVKRRRLGLGGDVNARYLLVRVQDKWLLSSVATGFEGNRLVGRLVPLESPGLQILREQIRKIDPKSAGLLPFEFNAVDGCASDQRGRSIGAWMAVFLGAVGLLLGLYLVWPRRPPELNQPAQAATGFSYYPPPNG